MGVWPTLKIAIDPSPKSIAVKLQGTARGFWNWRPAFRRIAQVVSAGWAQQFAAGGWAPDKAATVLRKARWGLSLQTLQASRVLASLMSNPSTGKSGAIRKLTGQ